LKSENANAKQDRDSKETTQDSKTAPLKKMPATAKDKAAPVGTKESGKKRTAASSVGPAATREKQNKKSKRP